MPDCYLTLLEDFESLISEPMRFTDKSRYAEINQARQDAPHKYPIGLIHGRIEIQFLHYQSETEALEKWERRLARMNFSNLAFKMCDRDGCTDDHMKRFDALDRERKVFFLSRPRSWMKCGIHIPGFELQGELPSNLIDLEGAHFDTARWINTGEISRPPAWIRALHRSLIAPLENCNRPVINRIN